MQNRESIDLNKTVQLIFEGTLANLRAAIASGALDPNADISGDEIFEQREFNPEDLAYFRINFQGRNEIITPLFLAVIAGRLDLVQELLAQGADINKPSTRLNLTSLTLVFASNRSFLTHPESNRMRRLLYSNNVDVNLPVFADKPWTLLQVAIDDLDVPALNDLLRARANIHAKINGISIIEYICNLVRRIDPSNFNDDSIVLAMHNMVKAIIDHVKRANGDPSLLINIDGAFTSILKDFVLRGSILPTIKIKSFKKLNHQTGPAEYYSLMDIIYLLLKNGAETNGVLVELNQIRPVKLEKVIGKFNVIFALLQHSSNLIKCYGDRASANGLTDGNIARYDAAANSAANAHVERMVHNPDFISRILARAHATDATNQERERILEQGRRDSFSSFFAMCIYPKTNLTDKTERVKKVGEATRKVDKYPAFSTLAKENADLVSLLDKISYVALGFVTTPLKGLTPDKAAIGLNNIIDSLVDLFPCRDVRFTHFNIQRGLSIFRPEENRQIRALATLRAIKLAQTSVANQEESDSLIISVLPEFERANPNFNPVWAELPHEIFEYFIKLYYQATVTGEINRVAAVVNAEVEKAKEDARKVNEAAMAAGPAGPRA